MVAQITENKEQMEHRYQGQVLYDAATRMAKNVKQRQSKAYANEGVAAASVATKWNGKPL
jgi:hypothetical protein